MAASGETGGRTVWYCGKILWNRSTSSLLSDFMMKRLSCEVKKVALDLPGEVISSAGPLHHAAC